MKEALGLKSKSGIHRLISALEERGFLRRLPNRARALEVLKLPDAARAHPRGHRDAVVPLRKPAPPLRPIAANHPPPGPLPRRLPARMSIPALTAPNPPCLPAPLPRERSPSPPSLSAPSL